MASSTTHSYSDQPTTRDELGFAPSAAALRAVIAGAALPDTPLTIGIFGPWGSGKTSLMHMLLSGLDTQHCLTVSFNAWRYAQTESLWRALLVSVVEALRTSILADDDRVKAIITRRASINPATESDDTSPDALNKERARQSARLDDLVDSLYRTVDREEPGSIAIDWKAAGKTAATAAIRLGFSAIPMLGAITKALEKAQEKVGEEDYGAALFDILKRERTKIHRDQVQSLDQFHQRLATLVDEWVVAHKLRLVVFIDDLDRCLPEQAVGVLEAIKVFLDITGCIFVLGVDRVVIEHGIRVRYKEFALDAAAAERAGQAGAVFPIAERDYLEKIVQIPFELPPLEDTAIERFLLTRLSTVEGLDTGAAALIATIMTAGLLPNPRKVKRAFNAFRLSLALSQAYQRPVTLARLAKVVVIQNSFNDLYKRIARRPALLRDIDAVARSLPDASSVADDIKQLVKGQPALQRMLYAGPSFSKTECRDDELNTLIFQTRALQPAPDNAP